MAKIKLTVKDLDLAAGTFHVNFDAEGNEIDEGQATAAYFTGFYLNSLINTPDFTDGVIRYGTDLIDNLQRDGGRPATDEPAVMVLTLEDKNLSTGRFAVTLEGAGGDETGESLPTTAQIVGGYMRYLLTDIEFRDAVWAFAEEFVANNTEAYIANNDQSSSEAA